MPVDAGHAGTRLQRSGALRNGARASSPADCPRIALRIARTIILGKANRVTMNRFHRAPSPTVTARRHRLSPRAVTDCHVTDLPPTITD